MQRSEILGFSSAKMPELVIWAVVLFALALAPLGINLYWMQALMWAMLISIVAISNDLLLGYSGVFAVGPLTFWAIGAFAAGLLSGGTHSYVPGGATEIGLGINPWLTIPIAGVIAALAGALVAFPSLRIRGVYLAFMLIAFSEVVTRALRNEEWLSGGTIGFQLLYKLPFIPFERISYYYLILGALLLTIIFLRMLVHSRFGLVLRAIRDNEIVARHLGIRVLRYRVLAFMLSSFFAGVSGALYAYTFQYITFDMGELSISFLVVVMSIFGGIGTLVGPFVGVLTYTILAELMRWLEEIRLVIFGAVVIVIFVFLPKGIVGTILERISRERIRKELAAKK